MTELQPYSTDAFYQELVARFFHPESFFYHCVNQELERCSHESDEPGREAFLLTGSLIDKLVDAPDTISELSSLEEIPGFQAVVHRLQQGAQALQNANYDAEQMKTEIRNLARAVVESACQALQHPETRTIFKERFEEPAAIREDGADTDRGDTQGEDLTAFNDSPECADASHDAFPEEAGKADADSPRGPEPEQLPTAEENGDDLSPFRNESEETTDELSLQLSDVTEIYENASDLSDDADGAGGLNFDVEMPEDDLSAEEDFLALIEPVEPESVKEDVAERWLDDKVPSDGECRGAEPAHEHTEAVAPAESQSGPEVAVDGGARQEASVETCLPTGTAEADNSKNSLVDGTPESVLAAFRQKMYEDLNKLNADIAAINTNYDDRAAWRRSRKTLERIAANAMIYGFEAFEQVASKANRFLAKHRDEFRQQPELVRNMLSETACFMESMLRADIDKSSLSAVVNFSRKLMDPHNFADPEPESAAAPVTTVPAHAERAEEEPSDVEFDADNLTLPGEDDEEILTLLREINNEHDQDGAASPNASVGPDSHQPSVLKVDDSAITEQPSPAGGEEVFKLISPVPSGSVEQFWQQAELYLNIADEALTQYGHQNDGFALFDDLELVCESLQSLAMKLNLESLGGFPDVLLALLKTCAFSEAELSDSDVKIIRDAFAAYENSANGRGEELDRLMASLKEMQTRFAKHQDDDQTLI